jgi:hypothetical protein
VYGAGKRDAMRRAAMMELTYGINANAPGPPLGALVRTTAGTLDMIPKSSKIDAG